MSVISEFVSNIMNATYDMFNDATIEAARDRLMDTLGCIISGIKAPGCKALIDLAVELGGKKEASIIGAGVKVPAHTAAMVNCVMARSYDFEPTGPVVDGKSTPAHLSGTTVPTALSTAEAAGVSGKDLLTALIVGDDMASRVIAASELNLDSGFEPTGTANVFGSTAIACKLLNLSESQMLNAFGIAINQFGGTFQNIFDGVHAFKLPQGLAAQAGVFSARLAKKGFTGVKDPLFSQYGYFRLYCKNYRLDLLTKHLGEQFYGDATRKPYPCCRSNHAAIDCILDILKTRELPPEDIEEVIVSIPQKAKDFAVGQPFTIRDVPQIDAAFSLQYAVANVILRKSVKLAHYTEEYIRDRRISDLIPRIHTIAGIPKEQSLAAEVKIVMKNGANYIKKVEMPKGNGTFTPLTVSEKRDKFIQNSIFAGKSQEKSVRMMKMIENIEQMDNIDELIQQINHPE